MSEVCGKTASVSAGGTVIAGLREWSIDYSGDALDVTDFADSGHRNYVAGLDGWTATCSGFGQPGWSTTVAVGTKYAGKFYVYKTSGPFYSGSVLCTGTSPASSVDGVATVEYAFQGCGELSYVES